MPRHEIPVALSIAGSDPTGGAGLQLDVRVLAQHRVHGLAVPTALVVQSTQGVHRVLPAFPNVVAEQLEALLADIVPDAIKIGMLATDDVLLRVAAIVDRCDAPRVVDPVLKAGDGTALLERRAYRNLLERIVPGATLLTPNLPEAEALTGYADAESAAGVLLEAGAQAVLVTGGHAAGAPHDFLLSDAGGIWIEGTRRGTDPVHGTGCALSSAIAARLARGDALEPAVRGAKDFVARAIERSFAPGKGQRLLVFD